MRGDRPRRGDRRRRRDADDPAQRARRRRPARLWRAVGARPARAVRLRPPGALRRADAGRPRPRARPRAAGARTRTPPPFLLARRRRAARDASTRPTGPSARARGAARRRSPGCAGRGRRRSAQRIAQAASEAERWLFSRLPEWEEAAAAPAAAPGACWARPRRSTTSPGCVGDGAEPREGQRAYAAAAARAFDPRIAEGRPQRAAGRGRHRHRQDARLSRPRLACGRTRRAARCGSPPTPRRCNASSIARRARVFPDAGRAPRKVVVRKGRENYLCLLNLEDALQGGFQGRAAILAQLVARWAAYSKDGDMVGGDLPGWLPTLFRRAGSTALTDRRGECVYAGCPHYRRCFIERSARAAEGADLVIANHALVMLLAAAPPRGGRAARPPRVRRGPSSVRRRRRDLRRRADRAGDDRAAALDHRPREQVRAAAGAAWPRACPMSPPMTRKAGARSRRRVAAAARAARPTAGSAGWPRGCRSARSSGCSPRSAPPSSPAPAPQDAGYGLETEAAELDAGADRGGRAGERRRWRRSSARSRGCASGSRRCWRTRPTGSTAPPARGSRARIAGLGQRAQHARRVDRAARPARRAGRSRLRRLAGGRPRRGARI